MACGYRNHIPALPFCDLAFRSPKPLDRAYPTELRTIGDHVRKRRLDLGLLQREAALRIGVDKTTVFNWEAGRTTPSLRARPAVITFLRYDPGETPSGLGEHIPVVRRQPDSRWPGAAGARGGDPCGR